MTMTSAILFMVWFGVDHGPVRSLSREPHPDSFKRRGPGLAKWASGVLSL